MKGWAGLRPLSRSGRAWGILVPFSSIISPVRAWRLQPGELELWQYFSPDWLFPSRSESVSSLLQVHLSVLGLAEQTLDPFPGGTVTGS